MSNNVYRLSEDWGDAKAFVDGNQQFKWVSDKNGIDCVSYSKTVNGAVTTCKETLPVFAKYINNNYKEYIKELLAYSAHMDLFIETKKKDWEAACEKQRQHPSAMGVNYVDTIKYLKRDYDKVVEAYEVHKEASKYYKTTSDAVTAEILANGNEENGNEDGSEDDANEDGSEKNSDEDATRSGVDENDDDETEPEPETTLVSKYALKSEDWNSVLSKIVLNRGSLKRGIKSHESQQESKKAKLVEFDSQIQELQARIQKLQSQKNELVIDMEKSRQADRENKQELEAVEEQLSKMKEAKVIVDDYLP